MGPGTRTAIRPMWWERALSPESFGDWWRPALLGLLLNVLYLPVFARLFSQFCRDPGYSHGFLIPFFSVYVVWHKRGQLTRTEKKPAAAGLWIVLAGIGMLFFGSIAAELFVTRISFVVVLVGLVLFFWGIPRARLLAFPVSFLLLMIPFPAMIYNPLVFPLQLVSSRFATNVLSWLNLMPVLREGNLLILPNCTLEVVEACSGIRSLLSLVTLAIAYGYLAERRTSIQALLALAMVPAAILGNSLRVVLAAVMAHYRGPQALEGYLHPISSLVILVVALLCLFALHGATRAVAKGLGY